MNRRKFVGTSASAGLLALPSWVVASVDEPSVKITRIRIGLDRRNPPPPDDENNYWSEAIQVGDLCFYRAKGTTVAASRREIAAVIGNPYLYYFTTALRLHMRIKWAKLGIPSDI